MIAKILSLLTRSERRELFLLMPAVVVMAVLEVAGIASVVPFFAMLASENAIAQQPALTWLYEAGGFASRESFFFAVGVAVLAVITLGNTFSAVTTYSLLRFSWLRNHSISERLLLEYLRRPYEFFLAHGSTELAKDVLSEVQQAVSGVIVQSVQLVARGVVLLFITAVVVVMSPLMALGLLVFFGGVYGTLFWFVRNRIKALGDVRNESQSARFKAATEVLAGIKELKVLGIEEQQMGSYTKPSRRFAEAMATSSVISQIPRFALETVAFGGVLIMVLVRLKSGGALEHVLPVVGLYAFAAYRMLPSLQVAFAGVSTIRFNLKLVEKIGTELAVATAATPASSDTDVRFERDIRLDRVGYTYPGASSPSLVGVDLRIRRGEWVALVGPTGSGKTTLVDILLGLLAPSSGAVLVDDEKVSLSASWRARLGYVPQQIFLTDDTLARNIAFGVATDAIDGDALRTAVSVAQLDEVLRGQAAGLDTIAGERGVRLSGGQRQRIGIARAIYRKPRLLVLDEATSALDTATEARFFEALKKGAADVTVLSIAHRLSTTRLFDRVVLVAGGRVIAEGTPADAIEGKGPFAILQAQAQAAPDRATETAAA